MEARGIATVDYRGDSNHHPAAKKAAIPPDNLAGKMWAVLRLPVIIITRLAWMMFNHIMYFPADLAWLLLLQPVKKFYPDVYWWIEGYLYRWILALVAAWGWDVGHRVIEYGEDVYKIADSRGILICNHQTTADVPVLMGLLQNKKNVVNHIMWIMDRMFKYTHFGFVANIHGDYFIQQGKECREQELRMLGDHIINWYYPRNRGWIVLFPEGGFLYKRKERSQAFAKKNDLPVLENVTLPRVGALQVLLQTMTRHQNGVANGTSHNSRLSSDDRSVQYIIDVTVGYADQEPLDFFSFAVGSKGPKNVHVFYRYYEADRIPRETDALTDWLYDRFVEKEALLDHLYKHGSYPLVKNSVTDHDIVLEGALKEDSVAWLASLHLFFFVSGCILYTLLVRVYSNVGYLA